MKKRARARGRFGASVVSTKRVRDAQAAVTAGMKADLEGFKAPASYARKAKRPPDRRMEPIISTELEAAARAYVYARESGRPTTELYRKLRRAWIAAVRADSLWRKQPRRARVR